MANSSEQSPSERQSPPQFTIRLLFSITTAIAVGFVSPLEPMVYLVNIVFFTSIIAVPVVVLWLVFTPASQWRESLGATSRVFVMAVAAFATIFVVILVRMEIMGQDF